MPHSIHTKRLTPPRARLLTAAALLSAGWWSPDAGEAPRARPSRTCPRQDRLVGERREAASSSARKPREPPAGGDRLRQVHARQRRAQLPRPERRRRLRLRTAGIDPHRPRSRRRRRSAGSSCRAAAPRPRGHAPLPADAGEVAEDRASACASTASPTSPTLGPRSRPTRSALASRVISDIEGVILLFPSTINQQSPAYRQALAACGAPPLGLRH